MPDSPGILVAKSEAPCELLPRYANRHGLITGATGTGKTVTLQVIAEGLAARGVPVFMADVKGDLAGLSRAGTMSPKLQERLAKLGIADHAFRAFPVIFWDLFGEQGHPVRATVSDLGPLLLGRLLDLNEVQTGVLNLVFKVADDQGLLLLDGHAVQFAGMVVDIDTCSRAGRGHAGELHDGEGIGDIECDELLGCMARRQEGHAAVHVDAVDVSACLVLADELRCRGSENRVGDDGKLFLRCLLLPADVDVARDYGNG